MTMSPLKLTKSLFEIDPMAVSEKISSHIRECGIDLGRVGILVPLSGGLDSSTVLSLCVNAVGADKVLALFMPEKQGNPEARKFAELMAGCTGVKMVIRDISSILSSVGTYRSILARIPSRRLQELLYKTYIDRTGEKPFINLLLGTPSERDRIAYATYNSKQRARVLVEYMEAERRNLMVAGSAHLTEDLVGLYVKFGVDDVADVMPLKNLYRSQILHLARYLNVPKEVLDRTPNPDILPGITNKYVDYLDIPAETLDLILYGLQHQMMDLEIAEQLGCSTNKVNEIRAVVAATSHMRFPSKSLDWE